MKYRYYITDTMDGEIRGTDSETIARGAAKSEDNFVIEADTGLWIQPEDEMFVRPTELKESDFSTEEEEEEDGDEDEDEDDDEDEG